MIEIATIGSPGRETPSPLGLAELRQPVATAESHRVSIPHLESPIASFLRLFHVILTGKRFAPLLTGEHLVLPPPLTQRLLFAFTLASSS
jgi:hypothetical protein